ncbi:hypothetical protein BD779DRAFT_137627 [Infundibulicybe gibba]|nr:hypothetical protein BD779DRAFT_137627 [Infundibulicybe gibba]
MRQPLKRSDAPLIARQSILKTKSMKFEHKAEDPLERLQHSMEKLKSYAPRQRRWSITHNQGPQFMKMCDPLSVSNAGQHIPPAKDKGQRLSTPLILQNLPASALDHTLENPRMDHRLAPRSPIAPCAGNPLCACQPPKTKLKYQGRSLT